LQFAGIALHTAEEVRDFAAELKMNYPVLVGQEEVIRVAEQYGNHTGMLPYTVIIDRQQRIAFIKHGPLSYEEAEAEITPLL
jgi:peroxiredoxin